MRRIKMKGIWIHFPEPYLDGMDELIQQKMYPNKAEIVRSAVRDLLKSELWNVK